MIELSETVKEIYKEEGIPGPELTEEKSNDFTENLQNKTKNLCEYCKEEVDYDCVPYEDDTIFCSPGCVEKYKEKKSKQEDLEKCNHCGEEITKTGKCVKFNNLFFCDSGCCDACKVENLQEEVKILKEENNKLITENLPITKLNYEISCLKSNIKIIQKDTAEAKLEKSEIEKKLNTVYQFVKAARKIEEKGKPIACLLKEIENILNIDSVNTGQN